MENGSIIDIELKGLEFLAYHGLYQEEKQTGAVFQVNVKISHLPSETVIIDLEDTINYAVLFNLIKSEMAIPRDLLETLAMEITNKIKSKFTKVKYAAITITKINPPISNFQGEVSVTYRRKF